MHTIKAYDHRGLVSTAKDVNSHAMCTQILPQVADVRWVGVCIVTLQWIDAQFSHGQSKVKVT